MNHSLLRWKMGCGQENSSGELSSERADCCSVAGKGEPRRKKKSGLGERVINKSSRISRLTSSGPDPC